LTQSGEEPRSQIGSRASEGVESSCIRK
jgi:hypothetical protein